MRIISWLRAASVGAALAASSAAAQPPAGDLSGHWTGIIEERDARMPRYTLSVHIAPDANGRPVGLVEYDAFPCAGVWAEASRSGAVWRFEETITRGVAQCAPHVVVELTRRGEALEVRLRPAELDGATGRGQLRRRP